MLEVTNTLLTGFIQITGNLVVGQSLTADPDGVADADGIASSFSYQWLRGGSGIDGANGTCSPPLYSPSEPALSCE